MPIRELTENTIEQSCDVCGRIRSAHIDVLCIGIVFQNHINPDVIPLPKCEGCGAVEYLIPSKEDAPDHPAPGSLGHRHAMLVEILHERLVSRGRAIKELDPSQLKKKKRTEEEIDRWFKDGLKLERPAPSEPPPEDDETKTKADKESSHAE
jgi:hypothetical protein